MAVHVDLSILEFMSGPEAMEEDGRDIKPITSDLVQGE